MQNFGKEIAHINHVLVQFKPYNVQNSCFTCTFKKHNFDEDFFSKKHDFD